MGNASYRQTTLGNQTTQSESLTAFLQFDLPKFVKQSMIGNGKFMKSYVMRADSTQVVVKVYMKLPDEDLQYVTGQLTTLWKTIPPTKFPNLMPYQMWMKSISRVKIPASPVYLMRQYFHTSLYDRLSTRPFLNDLEKLWIMFQLFKCLEICHELNIVHGDIKPENIMCTSSNWVILCDFAPFKPVVLPDDDPTDFQYYFDCMGRHRCGLAPERFFRKDKDGSAATSSTPTESSPVPASNRSSALISRFRGSTTPASGIKGTFQLPRHQANPAMDVFSLGCVMAEVLLDGAVLLDLPSMLQYLQAPGDTLDTLAGVGTKLQQLPARYAHLRNVIVDMTQREPDKRLSVSDYLDILEGRRCAGGSESASSPDPQLAVFPAYFSNCLYPLYLKLHWSGVTPDDRIHIIADAFGDLMLSLTGKEDEVGAAFFDQHMRSSSRLLFTAQSMQSFNTPAAVVLLPGAQMHLNVESARKKQTGVDGGPKLREDVLKGARAAALQSDGSKPFPDLSGTDSVSDLIARARRHIDEVQKLLNRSKDSVVQGGHHFVAAHPVDPCSLDDALNEYAQLVSGRSRNLGLFSFQGVHLPPATDSKSDGVVVVVDLLCANYRHLKFLPSRSICLLMLLRFGLGAPDAVITTRIVPLLLHALEDPQPVVRLLGLRTLTALLARVQSPSLLQMGVVEMCNFFPSYVFPYLNKLVKDSEGTVRMGFAECVGSLAVVAKRFLDAAHLLALSSNLANGGVSQPATGSAVASATATSPAPIANGANSAVNANANKETTAATADFKYDARLETLRDQVSRWIRDLIIDASTSSGASHGVNSSSSFYTHAGAQMKTKAQLASEACVKKSLLVSMYSICLFFGQDTCMDKILTQALTFMGDQDWELRQLFCSILPPICVFLGSTITSEYILPCIEHSIYDIEDRVAQAALTAISQMVSSTLVSRSLCVEFAKKAAPMLLVPAAGLRAAAAALIAAICTALGPVDTMIYIHPALQPFLSLPEQSSFALLQTAQGLQSVVCAPVSPAVHRRLFLLAVSELARDTGAFVRIDLLPEGGDLLAARDGDDAIAGLLREYVQTASREVLTKAVKWRLLTIGHAAANPSGLHAVGQLNRFNFTRNAVLAFIASPAQHDYDVYDSLLDYSSIYAQEHGSMSVLIPSMKAATYISEDMRRGNIYMTDNEARNKACVKALYVGNVNAQMDLFKTDDDLPSTPANTTVAVGQTPAVPLGINASVTGHVLTAPTPLAPSSSSLPPAPPLAAALYGDLYSKGAHRSYSFANMDSFSLLRRFRALKVPPLPVDLGLLVPASEAPQMSTTVDSEGGGQYAYQGFYDGASGKAGTANPWRPAQGVLFMTLREHAAAVNRLVVSPDQAFFASASSDSTVRIWQSRTLERQAFPRSSAVYAGHAAAVNDAVCIEGSHSVASASKDGSVHVWRVDLTPATPVTTAAGGAPANNAGDASLPLGGTARVVGSSLVRMFSADEGPVLAVQHFNSETASVVCMATQRGGLHGWDLRCPELAFSLKLRPELGHCTAMCVSPDRQWVCLGTQTGHLALWDLRYQNMSALFQHSSQGPIHRLACCNSLKGIGAGVPGLMGSAEGAYIFAASNNNEAAVFGLPEGGDCLKCFRSMSLNDSKAPISPLPVLRPVVLPSHPNKPIPIYRSSYGAAADGSNLAVRAMIGRISATNPSYLITAGSDRHLRFWDFRAPENCYTIAGLEATQSKSVFVAPKLGAEQGRLFVCYSSAFPSADKVLQSQAPVRDHRGLVLPSVNFKDAVLDLKDVELPMRMLLSASRDGEIKLWR